MTNQRKKYRIAIDGVSASGKSTLAKDIARCLKYIYIDTGAMYRAITYKFLMNNIDISNTDYIDEILQNTKLNFEIVNNRNCIFLDGENLEDKIRSIGVSAYVSEISAIEKVRIFLVKLQKEYGKFPGIVMDGRDIGTEVMPDADFKFFITADVEIRAKRRYEEMIKNTNDNIDFEEVLNNLKLRDYIDSTRKHSPLKIAEDAIIINTSRLTIEDQLKLLLSYIK